MTVIEQLFLHVLSVNYLRVKIVLLNNLFTTHTYKYHMTCKEKGLDVNVFLDSLLLETKNSVMF
jgi:hypothetical protein